jgi:hypothetical protein
MLSWNKGGAACVVVLAAPCMIYHRIYGSSTQHRVHMQVLLLACCHARCICTLCTCMTAFGLTQQQATPSKMHTCKGKRPPQQVPTLWCGQPAAELHHAWSAGFVDKCVVKRRNRPQERREKEGREKCGDLPLPRSDLALAFFARRGRNSSITV